jgi:hypothetical protein
MKVLLVALAVGVTLAAASPALAQTTTTTLPPTRGLLFEAEESGERLWSCTATIPAQTWTATGTTSRSETVDPDTGTATERGTVTLRGRTSDTTANLTCAAESVSRWLRVIGGLLGVLVACAVAQLVRPWLSRERV